MTASRILRAVALVVAALVDGCAPPRPTFLREIAPFEVHDASGRPFTRPFLGGFDVPRPQLVDIDGDGDLDLFVQERTGELIHFENLGSATEPRFRWRTDRWLDLDVGEWARLHDLDGDGDLDLLAEERFSYVRYFRNDGSPTEPRMVLAADSVRDETGKPIFADRQNIPALVDVDCDGRTDLFLGRVDGTVSRYEAAGLDVTGVPVFELVDARFEDIEIVAQLSAPGGPGAPSLHGANSMAFGDVDGDGDPDLYWGDYFEPGLLLIENVGSCSTPNLRVPPVPVPAERTILTSGYNAPHLADLDGDGDLDLLVGVLGGAYNASRSASSNLHRYERLSDGRLILRDTRYLDDIDFGSESSVAVWDLDGDGDLDLLVGSKLDPALPSTARLYRFENTGPRGAASFQLRDSTALLEAFHYAPELADLDGDGRAELLLGTWNDDVHWYRDEGARGSPRWVPVSGGPLVELPRGSHSVPAAGDLDGDGDLDLVVGEASGELNLFRNVGSTTSPRFELVSEKLGGVDVGRRSAPTLVDLDGDGDLDLLVGREEAGAVAFLNRGWSGREPAFEPAPELGLPLPRLARPRLLDLVEGGELELLSGGSGGGLVFLRAPAGIP